MDDWSKVMDNFPLIFLGQVFLQFFKGAMMKTFFSLSSAFFLALTSISLAQQTPQIGLVFNTPQSYNGYTLFAPDFTTTYLIDNCGRTVKTWQSQYMPGQSAYLLEDGSLFRPARTNASRTFTVGGTGGRLER
jgi:hypothetical protein